MKTPKLSADLCTTQQYSSDYMARAIRVALDVTPETTLGELACRLAPHSHDTIEIRLVEPISRGDG